MQKESQSEILEFLDLGPQPISNEFPKEPFSAPAYRLSVGLERDSGLVRLLEQPIPAAMFHADYAFETRTSRRMVNHFVETAMALLDLVEKPNDLTRVLEVGSNDGAFLEACMNLGAQVLGIDPSSGVNEIARAHGVEIWEGFFSIDESQSIRDSYDRFDLAYSANALCHIPNFEDNLRAFTEILVDDGVLVFEDPYLGSVLTNTTYDQFYDEHYYMFAATSVQRVANIVGLTLFDVEALSTHGGSMRYFLSKKYRAESTRLQEVLRWERFIGVEDLGALTAFASNVRASANFLQEQLALLRRVGIPVVGLGAASKTVTVLNYAAIGADGISEFSDSTPSKAGTFMAGTNIPVVSQSSFSPPKEFVAFLGAHNHEMEILGALAKNGITPTGVLSSIPFSTVR
jgi:methylation protein EvaC